MSEKGFAKPYAQSIDFPSLMPWQYADQESLLFWTNLPVTQNYTYPEQTPCRKTKVFIYTYGGRKPLIFSHVYRGISPTNRVFFLRDELFSMAKRKKRGQNRLRATSQKYQQTNSHQASISTDHAEQEVLQPPSNLTLPIRDFSEHSDTVVKILGYGYPLRARCNACVV